MSKEKFADSLGNALANTEDDNLQTSLVELLD